MDERWKELRDAAEEAKARGYTFDWRDEILALLDEYDALKRRNDAQADTIRDLLAAREQNEAVKTGASDVKTA
jgi:hypothetical protein